MLFTQPAVRLTGLSHAARMQLPFLTLRCPGIPPPCVYDRALVLTVAVSLNGMRFTTGIGFDDLALFSIWQFKWRAFT